MRKVSRRSQPQESVAAPAAEASAGSTPPPTAASGTGIYVDVENLRANGQQVVSSLLDTWPESVPPPKLLTLYVRADLVELWRLWATNQFHSLDITVKGVQHFSTHSSKNSADIAIATDAISDLLQEEVQYLAVVSDDSDFIALYAAVRDRMAQMRPDLTRVPFMWVITDRNDTLSTTVRQYFPREAIYVVPFEEQRAPVSNFLPPAPRVSSQASQGSYRQGPSAQRAPAPVPPRQTTTLPPQEMLAPSSIPGDNGAADETQRIMAGSPNEIVEAIVEQLPVGIFKSTDCQQIIRRRWPGHSLASASGPAFGTEFLRSIWPLLESRGARVSNPGQSPRRYEMTETAKRLI